MDTNTTTTPRLRRIGKALATDLSLHGITYLGVLVVFASLLGLLLFSFADIPNSQQPFYELGMASVFFGFAWYLRRQKAKYAARAMELVGGMTLPLALYAGFVDEAPFPPDFEDGILIVVMTATAVALSAVYRLISQNNEETVLGYLVAPLWWLAAMAAGFVFKADEPLNGDAITRLVTEQPALAAAAIAVTLVTLRHDDRVRKPALVAAPAAYLLTLTLAAGESWEPTLALLVSGLSTLVAVEVLALGTRAASRLPAWRPFLVAAVLLPLLPRLETHLIGVVVFSVYLVLFEVSSRTSSSTIGLLWTRVGIGTGAALTWNHGWSGLIVFAALTLWGVYRLRLADEATAGEYEAIVAFAPIGVGHGLLLLLPDPDAFAVMAAIAGVVALTGSRVGHRLLAWWPTAASVAIALGVAATSPDLLPLTGVAALVIVGLVVVLANRESVGRFWFAAITLTAAMVSLFDRFPSPEDVATLTLAITGAAVVAGTFWRHDRLNVNASYFGLMLTLGSGLVGGPGWAALAFLLVAVRGVVSAHFTTGPVRMLNQAISVAAAVASWLSLFRYLELGVEVVVGLTGLTWGALALAAAVAGRVGRLKADWVWAVGTASTIMIGAAVMGLTVVERIDITLPIGIALLALAVEVSWKQTHQLLRMTTPPLLVAAWLIGLSSLEVGFETAVWTTAIVAGVATAIVVEAERIHRTNAAVMASRIGVPVLALVLAWLDSLLVRDLAVGAPVSAGIALTGLAFGRLARPLQTPELRIAASVLWVVAVLNLAWSASWSGRELAIVSAVVAAVAVLAYLAIWQRDRETEWALPLVGVAVIADFVALGLAMTLFPDQGVGVVVSLSIATQTLAAGTVLSSPGLLAVAPPAAAAGFLFAIGDTLGSHVSWWTVPLGVVGLAEIEILRAVRRRRGAEADTTGSIAMEMLSGAVIVLPILASLFTDGLIFAAGGLLAAVAGMAWGAVTRLRRRVYGAAGVALVTTVLTLVAAAASTAPESVGFWVIGAGIGMTVLLVAGYVETYRTSRGQLVQRLDRLMEGWS